MKTRIPRATHQTIAARIGVATSTLGRWKRDGAPINGDYAALLRWWTSKYPSAAPPPSLVLAAKGDAPREASVSSEMEAAGWTVAFDIDRAVEAQRRNLCAIQRDLVTAQRRKDDIWSVRWGKAVERASFCLARLERVAAELAVSDTKWVPLETAREAWKAVNDNLEARLREVAFHPERETLRSRWDDAVRGLLLDPFGGAWPPQSEPETEDAPLLEGDIEWTAEQQRRSFGLAQHQLDQARTSRMAPTMIEMRQQQVDRAGLGLARLETLAMAARSRDPRWLAMDAFRDRFDQAYAGLNETLFGVADHPDTASLPTRWAQAVKEILTDPFPSDR